MGKPPNAKNVCAKLCAAVKRVLNKHGYPPDKREKATETVLEQAEALSAFWAEETPTDERIDRIRG